MKEHAICWRWCSSSEEIFIHDYLPWKCFFIDLYPDGSGVFHSVLKVLQNSLLMRSDSPLVQPSKVNSFLTICTRIEIPATHDSPL